MKKIISLLFAIQMSLAVSLSQVYNPVSYAFNGTPSYGIKIKTNLPFSNSSQMPTIIIEGYNYGGQSSIGLTLNYYIYDNNFWYPKLSSWGGWTPSVKMAVENNKVVIYIEERGYFQRFNVRAYANGMGESPDWFGGWTIVDEPIAGSNITTVNYQNNFSGVVFLPGNGLWNSDGSVGIGTQSINGYKLNVSGKIRANEIIVNTSGADFVFDPEYNLPDLVEVEKYIEENKHLPDVAPASVMQSDGMNVSEMQTKMLQKIEELTLYIIQQNKTIEEQNLRIEKLENSIK